jgi:hypothetical protein
MSHFKILNGLPGNGDLPSQFSATGMGTHSEGFVVEFFPDSERSWIGNFQRALTKFDAVFEHPDNFSLGVIAGGECYVINPDKKECSEYFGGWFQSLRAIPEKHLVILGTPIDFIALGSSGVLWKSSRLSWDGIRNVRLDGEELFGEVCCLDDTWIPFSLSITSGKHTGGDESIPNN